MSYDFSDKLNDYVAHLNSHKFSCPKCKNTTLKLDHNLFYHQNADLNEPNIDYEKGKINHGHVRLSFIMECPVCGHQGYVWEFYEGEFHRE